MLCAAFGLLAGYTTSLPRIADATALTEITGAATPCDTPGIQMLRCERNSSGSCSHTEKYPHCRDTGVDDGVCEDHDDPSVPCGAGCEDPDPSEVHQLWEPGDGEESCGQS